MDKILFKGKRENGEWVYGFYVHCEDVSSLSSHTIYTGYADLWQGDFICEKYDIIPGTVGQYIGRKDKNKVKIFEHDIVETKYGRICEVVRVCFDTYCGWDLKPIGKYDCKSPDKWDMWNTCNLVVIGNVFDNLDLMEEKK